MITDTVGFIEDLPDTLVKAFASTLEELDEADLLLHVVDGSDPDAEAHLAAVDEVLEGLGLQNAPRLLVWNKAEIADPVHLRARIDRHGGLPVSAVSGEGCERLLDRMDRALFRERSRQAAEARRAEAGA